MIALLPHPLTKEEGIVWSTTEIATGKPTGVVS